MTNKGSDSIKQHFKNACEEWEQGEGILWPIECLDTYEGVSAVFSHVMVGVNDFDRALAFYEPVLASLGIAFRFADGSRPWAGWQSSPDPRPLFLIARPYNGQAHQAGNGQMVAFVAASRSQVDQAYALALAHGGTCEGEPGLRPEYHAHYYGAYFRDPDGNKLCVACHAAEG